MPLSEDTLYKLRMAGCGLALGLSAPGFGFWKLAWLALIPALYWSLRQKSLKTVFWGGILLGFAFQGLYCLWFFDLHPLTWLGFDEVGSRLVTLAGWLLIATEGGLLTGLLFALYRKLPSPWGRLFLFPALWVLVFSLLNCTPMALPWGLLEYTQASLWPMRLLVGWISGSGLTVLLVLHNTAWSEYFRNSGNLLQTRWKFFLPVILPVILGLIQQIPNPYHSTTPWPMPVAVAQADIPIEIIRSGQLNQNIIGPAYINPIQQMDLPPGTLLVYPEEGVAPGWTPTENPYANPNLKALAVLATQKKIYIAVGVSAIAPDNRRYNAIAVIPPNSAKPWLYYKRRLVPFGEFTPYGMEKPITELLGRLGIEYSTPYDAGGESPVFKAGQARIGALVCFELIDSAPLTGGYAVQYKRHGANLLINASNLGWFHENPLMEAQFLAIGQIRAAETRLPIVISSNTGISAILSDRGDILKRTYPQQVFQHKTQVIFYNGKQVTIHPQSSAPTR